VNDALERLMPQEVWDEFKSLKAALAAALLRAEKALTREGEMFAQATERMLQANDLHVALTAAESRAEVLADALRLERAKALEDAAREVEGYVGAGRAIWPSEPRP